MISARARATTAVSPTASAARAASAGIWGTWAHDLVHRTADAGHSMAEQDPDLVIATVRELLGRRPGSTG